MRCGRSNGVSSVSAPLAANLPQPQGCAVDRPRDVANGPSAPAHANPVADLDWRQNGGGLHSRGHRNADALRVSLAGTAAAGALTYSVHGLAAKVGLWRSCSKAVSTTVPLQLLQLAIRAEIAESARYPDAVSFLGCDWELTAGQLRAES